MDSYLAHHGIKGMKWGIRRFRNEDGTLTEVGKKRYGNYTNEKGVLTDKGEKKLASDMKSGREGLISGSRNLVSGARRMVDASGSQSRNRYNKRKNLTQEEMDAMSDDDLRKLINRLNLEQQYSTLTEEPTARDRVRTGLDYAEATLSIVGGAMGVAVAYKLLHG